MPLSTINSNSFSSTANTNIDNGTLFIDAINNRVGVGSTTPQSPLEVYGLIRTTGFVSNPTSGAGMEFAWDGTNGIVQAFSNRTAGTTAPVYFTGGQIKFPATQNSSADANTLDDYEEGTFTPDARVAGRTSSWSTKVGKYIKIGRVVTVWCMFDGGNSGATDTYSVVSGLPFTPGAGHGNQTSGIWGANNLSPTTGNMFVNNGDTTALIMYGGGNQPGYFSYFSCMITYLANA
jgi:hypothetical protein